MGGAMNYEARLIDREGLDGNVTVFRFTKPEDYRFIAGQWCYVYVSRAGYEDDGGLGRVLTIASSPLEEDLIFVTELGDSAMKRRMAELTRGDRVVLGPPMGSMTLPTRTEAPLLFLAEGIGVAPFRSICRYVSDARTGHVVTLLYAGKRPEATPFLDDFMHIAKRYPDFSLVVTMTNISEGQSTWNGLRGPLSEEFIKARCPVWTQAIYYIAALPQRARALEETVAKLGIPPGRIRVEAFTRS
jgi:ferredoxin-NADP reductase